jgi:type I restriction enzyme S subunit
VSASEQQTLNDVCEFIVDCLHKTAPIQEDGYPSIRTPNVGRGRLILEGVNRVSQAVYDEWTKRAIPVPGDLILAREAPAGNVAIIKEGQTVCLGQRTVHLRPDRSKVDPDFLCYFLLTPRQQGALLASETGATAGHVNMRDIRRLKLGKLPEKHVQERAAHIISTYDDLIENNRRRIALLEEAARMLYREWFVHFRFPGHEHVKMIDGLPEGWEPISFSDVCETIGGGTPKTEKPEYWNDGDIPWYTPTDITRNSCLALLESATRITEAGLRGSSAKMLPSGTVLMTSRASVGYFGIIGAPSCTNQGFISIIPRNPSARMYILHNLMHRVEEIRSHAGGATYKEISKGQFRALKILIPTAPLLREFEQQVTTLHAQVCSLHTMNQRLAQARDLLLPRLMNGEIAV